MYNLGIDPGWVNLGVSIVEHNKTEDKLSLVGSWVMNPSEIGFNDLVLALVKKTYTYHPRNIVIERYAPYKNVNTAESENITMLVGGLRYGLSLPVTNPELSKPDMELLRAIDWKIELVKLLHTQTGFDNPSDSLDKKFSIAAAKACLPDEDLSKITDHEADAICLAALPALRWRKAQTKH